MLRMGALIAVLAAALVAASAQPADSSRYMRVGIYDEAQTLYDAGNATEALERLDAVLKVSPDEPRALVLRG